MSRTNRAAIRVMSGLVMTAIAVSQASASFVFVENFDAPPLTPGTSGASVGDWEDGFVNGDNGWLVIETVTSGNNFGQRDISGATPGDHFNTVANARTRNAASAFMIRDLTATPLASGTVTFDITRVLATHDLPVFQLRLANTDGTDDGIILRFGELEAADNNRFDVQQVLANGTLVQTVADSSTTTTSSAPLNWNSFFSTTSGHWVNLTVGFDAVAGTASVVVTTTDHLGNSSSTAPVNLSFTDVLAGGVERVSLQMLAPTFVTGVGGLLYIDNYSITGELVPEPASLALVSFGAVLMMRRRRESASGGLRR